MEASVGWKHFAGGHICEHRMQKIYNQNQCTQISRQAAVSVVVDVVEKGAANNQPTCECVWIVRAISA